MNDSGAVGVHEWCEIRLIRAKGRLALCEESGRIWHSWWAFWLLFAHTKSNENNNTIIRLYHSNPYKHHILLKSQCFPLCYVNAQYHVCHRAVALIRRFSLGYL